MIIQYRNGIVDLIWGFRPATCFCVKHFRFWKEGDNFPQYGGRSCKECCVKKLFNNKGIVKHIKLW
jgi:hypothetical protein